MSCSMEGGKKEIRGKFKGEVEVTRAMVWVDKWQEVSAEWRRKKEKEMGKGQGRRAEMREVKKNEKGKGKQRKEK